jgi:restriction endonuclease S subunit
LEGLEISEVLLSKVFSITKTQRFDAEFFKKDLINQDKNLANKDLKTLSEITDKIDVGFVGSMVSNYVLEGGVKLLQTKNISEFFINDNDVIRINHVFHNQLKKSQLNYENILIARSGSFGKASIFLKNEVINSSDIIIINANKAKINPYYLVTYLNSYFGVKQMMRFASGGLQGHVNLAILEELVVPILSLSFQTQIENLVKLAHSKLEESKTLYTSAENLLLSALGLNNFESKKVETNYNIKSFKDSFLTSGRLDAEYYQPKYEELEKKIREYEGGFCKLKDLVVLCIE